MNVGRRRFFCHTSLAAAARHRRATAGRSRSRTCRRDEPAAILFTSGSTGVAKGAVYTHGIFAAQVEMLKATYGIEPGEVDLCTFPLFALFGPALGHDVRDPGHGRHPPGDASTRAKAVAQIRAVRRDEPVRLAGGDPAAGGLASASLGRIESDAGRTLRAARLRRVISAGAPASAPVIERFVKLLPESREVFTPYGATEALPVANIGSREILGETRHLTDQGKGVCVGRPVRGDGRVTSSRSPTSRSRSGTSRCACRRARSASSWSAGRW